VVVLPAAQVVADLVLGRHRNVAGAGRVLGHQPSQQPQRQREVAVGSAGGLDLGARAAYHQCVEELYRVLGVHLHEVAPRDARQPFQFVREEARGEERLGRRQPGQPLEEGADVGVGALEGRLPLGWRRPGLVGCVVPQVGGVHPCVGAQQPLGPVQHHEEAAPGQECAQALHAVAHGPLRGVYLAAAGVGDGALQEALEAGLAVVEAPPQRAAQVPTFQAGWQEVVVQPVPGERGLAHTAHGDDGQGGVGGVDQPAGEGRPLRLPPGEVLLRRVGVGDVGGGGWGDAGRHVERRGWASDVECLCHAQIQRQSQRAQTCPTFLVHAQLVDRVIYADAVDLGVAGGADGHQVVLGVWPALADGHDVVQVHHFLVLRAEATPVHRIYQYLVSYVRRDRPAFRHGALL